MESSHPIVLPEDLIVPLILDRGDRALGIDWVNFP
ncbi:hypothetical protein MESS2_500009 [Mesorhizobium metallidurans STM 2683]|uniref:Uncharacterized protein n=1 Tax=Mesorhizobium metallidurans STM 2683 TaxID=1297569 RepID=M5ETA6_9HYPH|nr:hypothetical protein MESS2_500009 [Mesorhizobium metallidurans STM 2683]